MILNVKVNWITDWPLSWIIGSFILLIHGLFYHELIPADDCIAYYKYYCKLSKQKYTFDPY